MILIAEYLINCKLSTHLISKLGNKNNTFANSVEFLEDKRGQSVFSFNNTAIGLLILFSKNIQLHILLTIYVGLEILVIQIRWKCSRCSWTIISAYYRQRELVASSSRLKFPLRGFPTGRIYCINRLLQILVYVTFSDSTTDYCKKVYNILIPLVLFLNCYHTQSIHTYKVYYNSG